MSTIDPSSIATGVAAALSTLAILPMLFRGQILFKREGDRIEAACKDKCDLLAAQITEREERIETMARDLLAANEELKEQYKINAVTTREVIDTVKVLQGLAGLAVKDRRARPGGL